MTLIFIDLTSDLTQCNWLFFAKEVYFLIELFLDWEEIKKKWMANSQKEKILAESMSDIWRKRGKRKEIINNNLCQEQDCTI